MTGTDHDDDGAAVARVEPKHVVRDKLVRHWLEGEAGRDLVAVFASSINGIAAALESQVMRDAVAGSLRQGAGVVRSDAARVLIANSLDVAAETIEADSAGRALADALRAVVHTAESDSAHAAVQTAVQMIEPPVRLGTTLVRAAVESQTVHAALSLAEHPVVQAVLHSETVESTERWTKWALQRMGASETVRGLGERTKQLVSGAVQSDLVQSAVLGGVSLCSRVIASDTAKSLAAASLSWFSRQIANSGWESEHTEIAETAQRHPHCCRSAQVERRDFGGQLSST